LKEIIFLMGLPRSGTTLLQRVMASHPEIASIAEPWVLLPLMTCFDERMTTSVYGHSLLKQALADLYLEYPEFQSEYDAHIRQFISGVYGKLSGSKKYFLDKTPRYYLIAKDLHRVFPESRFVYLFRNPLDVFDSTIGTFCSDRLYRLAYCHADLMSGLNLLCAPLVQGKPNIHTLTYEEFCSGSDKALQKICAFLEIPYNLEMLHDFANVTFTGKLGDPNRNRTQQVARNERRKPLSIIRRHLYRRWIGNISAEAWAASGYSSTEVLAQLRARPMAGLWKQLDDAMGFAVFRITMFFGYKLVSRFKNLRGASSSDIDAFLY